MSGDLYLFGSYKSTINTISDYFIISKMDSEDNFKYTSVYINKADLKSFAIDDSETKIGVLIREMNFSLVILNTTIGEVILMKKTTALGSINTPILNLNHDGSSAILMLQESITWDFYICKLVILAGSMDCYKRNNQYSTPLI